MIRLNLSASARWIDLVPGLRLHVLPVTTAVMASDNETTATRAAVSPVPAPAAVAVQDPLDEIEEEKEKKSRGPVVVLLVLAGLLLVGMVVAIFMILKPGVEA